MDNLTLIDSKLKVARLQACVSEVKRMLDRYDIYGGEEVDETIELYCQDMEVLVLAIGCREEQPTLEEPSDPNRDEPY